MTKMISSEVKEIKEVTTLSLHSFRLKTKKIAIVNTVRSRTLCNLKQKIPTPLNMVKIRCIYVKFYSETVNSRGIDFNEMLVPDHDHID